MKSFNSTDPDSINYEQLQVRISESVKALGKDEWLPSGGHIIHEQGKVIFRHFPGLNECSASYITPLQDQITDDLRELSRDWE